MIRKLLATTAIATIAMTGAYAAGDRVEVPGRETLRSLEIGTVSSDNVIGTAIYSADDQSVGDIAEVIMSDDGKVEAVIVDVGGFLGIGAKPVALSFTDLDFRADDSGNIYIYAPYTAAQLREAPAYVAKDYPNNRDRMLLKSKS